MSEETEKPDRDTLTWSAKVWSHLTAVECVGILWIALRYDPREESSGSYIERMSLLPWLSLGEPLQLDIARALIKLRQQFSR